MARVVIENLDKDFLGPKKEPIHALRDVSLVVEDKELVVLVGPSGCGKTTLLRIIAGLEESSRGGVSIDGKAMSRVPAKDRDVAMVFQNCALYPHLTVYDNIAFGLMLRKYTKAETERRVLEAVEILGLKSCLDRMPNQLSGGERQRVALGRAIVRKPKVFLLDEPLSNLDAVMRSQMRVELAKLHARLEATMLYVTHDHVEAMTLGHRIAVMNEGAIQQVAEPMVLYRRPASTFVAAFAGSPPMNFIRGSLRATRDCLWFDENTNGNGPGQEWPVFCLRSRVRSRLEGFVDRDVLLGIRPEDVAVELAAGDAKAEAPDAAPLAKAAVEVVEPRGAETFLYLAIGRHALVARVHPDFPARVGETVSVVFNLEGAHFFDPATGLSIVTPGGTVGE